MFDKSQLNSLHLRGKKVLIVEDDFISAQLIKELFKDTHVEMIHVLNAAAAIDIINNNIKIDVVLLDIQLPDMNGLHVAKHIKTKNKNIPIIVQTAYAFDTYIAKSKEIGCDYFMAKPIDANKLFEIFSKLFH
jgi:CheY-like chemotaxis protein